jgi:uncharacterized CHY-type Zn-finger protein
MSIIVKGKPVDEQTRCFHYHSALDVIAIKFKCCNTYYPCWYCHEDDAGHKAELWQKDEFETEAIFCGVCKKEMSIAQYKSSKYQCINCKTAFNPKCSNHDYLYFEK